jgi:polysaccharide export outer membrane protein
VSLRKVLEMFSGLRVARAIIATSVAAAMISTAIWAHQEPATSDGYTVGPQDVLNITCVDDPAISGKFTVPSDGTIGLLHIGSVKVSGLTLREVENLLKEKYKAGGFLLNPRIYVTVEIFKSQHVIIQGEVRAPGAYALTGGTTLIELVAQAGSLTSTASGDIMIVREESGKQQFIRADLSQMQEGAPDARIKLQNGDLVIVHQADRAYVIGEVKNPNAFPVQRGTTLMQLLSLAGGPTADAATNRIRIFRTEKGKQIEIKNAKQTEIIKPGDTVVVPVRFF